MIKIQLATESDFKDFWPTFSTVVKAQETYAFDADISYQQALDLWCQSPLRCYVAVDDEQVLASYYLRANGMGPSAHIANCGYMVSEQARGRGLATTLCEHSQETAKAMGFKAMQFNSVVSTNEIAVKLWLKLGFTIIGRVPKGYLHKSDGYVDTLIMHKAFS